MFVLLFLLHYLLFFSGVIYFLVTRIVYKLVKISIGMSIGIKKGKNFNLDHIILRLKEGKKAKEIAKELGISSPNLSYYLRKLKNSGEIEYLGKGEWLVKKSIPYTLVKKSNASRGHAFIWKVKINRKIDWKKHLDKKNIKYKLQSNNKVLRIVLSGRKIWLTKEKIIIFEPRDYFGRNSYQAKGKAVYEMDKIVKKLFNKLGMAIISYKFTTSREHYGLIKNELARQYNDRGEKLHIKSEEGKEWLWIDDSLSLGELENNEMKVNKQVQDFWNDNKKHNFQVTPSFILESIGGVVQNQMIFDKNIELHQSVLEDIRDAVIELKKEIKNLKNG